MFRRLAQLASGYYSNRPLRRLGTKIFYNHPAGRDKIAGAKIMSIDELIAEIRSHRLSVQRDRVIAAGKRKQACGSMIKNAISERYPLLRTIQMSHVDYYRAISHPSDSH